MFRIKTGKGIDAGNSLQHQVPKNVLRHHSNEERHTTEDTVDSAELNKSEARPKNKSSLFRSTNGTLAEVESSFENEPDADIEKSNEDYCENNKQEHKSKEENELGNNDKGKGHVTEDASHNHLLDPEGSAGEDRDCATGAAALTPCAEEEAQANSETGVPVQPRNEVSQV